MKRNEHTTVILVHSNELHPVSPNPRWIPLKKNVPNTLTQPLFLNPTRKLAHLLKNTILAQTLFKKPYQEEFTNTLLQEFEIWNEYT